MDIATHSPPLLTSILLLLVASRLLGEFFNRIGQPPIAGDMLAGILLGPAVLNFIEPNSYLHAIADLAVFMIVLSAGLEMNFKDVINAIKGKALKIAIVSFILPFMAGILIGIIYSFDLVRSIFLGLCISITALPVCLKLLNSFNLLNTKIGRYSVATAVLNDIVALLLLGILINMPAERSFKSLIISMSSIGMKLVLLTGFIILVNWAIQEMQNRGVHLKLAFEKIIDVFGNEAFFGIVILFVLVFSSISELLGFHFIIGAFFGALLIDRQLFLKSRFSELEKTINALSQGFLAPLFFGYLGLQFTSRAFEQTGLLFVIITLSFFSKALGGWFGSQLQHMKNNDSIAIGVILNSRGGMDLVAADIAYSRGFINQSLFSILILMSITTTLVGPFILKKYVKPQSTT